MQRCTCDRNRNNPYALASTSRHHSQRSSPKAIIALSQGSYKIPMSTIHKHIPGGYQIFKNANAGPVIDPLDWLRQFITSNDQLIICEQAMMWIFHHVKLNRTLECVVHMRQTPLYENPLEIRMDEMNTAYNNDDESAYYLCLEVAVSTLLAICFILKQRNFDMSSPLSEAVHKSTCRLLPYMTAGDVGGDAFFRLMRAIGETDIDPYAVIDLIQRIPVTQKLSFNQECVQAAQLGDNFAINILPYI